MVTRFEAEEARASRAMLERMGVDVEADTGATVRVMSDAGGGGSCFACACAGWGRDGDRDGDRCSDRAFEGECASERALVGGDCTSVLAFEGGECTSVLVLADGECTSVVRAVAVGAGAGAGAGAAFVWPSDSERALVRGDTAGTVCATTSSGSRLLKCTLDDDAELVDTIVVVTVLSGGIWAPPPEMDTKLRAWNGSSAARAAAASAALRAAAAGESGGDVVHGGDG